MKHTERADEGIEVNDYPGTIILEPRKANACITSSKTNKKPNNQTNQAANQQR